MAMPAKRGMNVLLRSVLMNLLIQLLQWYAAPPKPLAYPQVMTMDGLRQHIESFALNRLGQPVRWMIYVKAMPV